MAIEFLDLWQALVVEVFGSPILFFVVLLFGIIVMSAVMRWSQRITLVTIVAVSLILSFYINRLLGVILLLVLAGVGLAYARFVSRG